MRKRVIKILMCLFLFWAILLMPKTYIFAETTRFFMGEGARENPYLVESAEDLILLRDLVNAGDAFDKMYFKQTQDIDLGQVEWIPIGLAGSGRYFYGIYDGNGHIIKNLTILEQAQERWMHAGLFGVLGGTVANLGLEDGIIQGDYSGAFAAHAIGTNAAILNCYSNVSVNGKANGGVASTFEKGLIANVWTTANIYGEDSAGILAQISDAKIYHCFTTDKILVPKTMPAAVSEVVALQTIFTKNFAARLSWHTALISVLFEKAETVTLKQWQIGVNEKITWSDEVAAIRLVQIVNEYFALFLLIIFLVYYFKQLKKLKIADWWNTYRIQWKTYATLFFIFAFFIDASLVYTGISVLNVGNLLVTILVHCIFSFCAIICWKNRSKNIFSFRQYWPLLVAIIAIICLELLQFNLVPRYDGHLYYGSLVQGLELYQFDFFTFLGAFMCWRWAQGLYLLLAPFEFLFPGQMIGIYCANLLITIITMVVLYQLLQNTFEDLSNVVAAICSATFILFPYGLGLFTYLSMDWHLMFFCIWLLAAYNKKNHIAISLIGLLLAFTKITGLVFYVFFLATAGILELLKKQGPFVQKLKSWWNTKKVILWVLPTLPFLLMYYKGNHFVIQNFVGSASGSTIGTKSWGEIASNFLQSFIFGFRWLLLLAFLLGLIYYLLQKGNKKQLLTPQGRVIMSGVALGCFGVFCMLTLFRGSADCPRYTTVLNVGYIFLCPVIYLCLFRTEKLRRVAAGMIGILFLVQTYWTIDPALIYGAQTIETGTKQIYKLGAKTDARLGMNLGTSYALGYEVVGDLYAYNLEYTYYDDLLQQMLVGVQPDAQDVFLVLDLYPYELHLTGMQYPIYWNTRQQKRTYDASDKDSILLQEQGVTTDQLAQAITGLQEFYLIVPARVNEEKAVAILKNGDLHVSNVIEYQNVYGSMRVYQAEKRA